MGSGAGPGGRVVPPGAFSAVQTYLLERIDEVLTNGTTDDIVVRVYGTVRGRLGALGNQLAAVLTRVPGLTDVLAGAYDPPASRSPSMSRKTWRSRSRVLASGSAHRPREAASSRRSAMPRSAHGLDRCMNERVCSSNT